MALFLKEKDPNSDEGWRGEQDDAQNTSSTALRFWSSLTSM